MKKLLLLFLACLPFSANSAETVIMDLSIKNITKLNGHLGHNSGSSYYIHGLKSGLTSYNIVDSFGNNIGSLGDIYYGHNTISSYGDYTSNNFSVIDLFNGFYVILNSYDYSGSYSSSKGDRQTNYLWLFDSTTGTITQYEDEFSKDYFSTATDSAFFTFDDTHFYFQNFANVWSSLELSTMTYTSGITETPFLQNASNLIKYTNNGQYYNYIAGTLIPQKINIGDYVFFYYDANVDILASDVLGLDYTTFVSPYTFNRVLYQNLNLSENSLSLVTSFGPNSYNSVISGTATNISISQDQFVFSLLTTADDNPIYLTGGELSLYSGDLLGNLFVERLFVNGINYFSYIKTDNILYLDSGYAFNVSNTGFNSGSTGGNGSSGTGSTAFLNVIWDEDGDGSVGFTEFVSGVGKTISAFFGGIGDFFVKIGDFLKIWLEIGNTSEVKTIGFLDLIIPTTHATQYDGTNGIVEAIFEGDSKINLDNLKNQNNITGVIFNALYYGIIFFASIFLLFAYFDMRNHKE